MSTRAYSETQFLFSKNMFVSNIMCGFNFNTETNNAAAYVQLLNFDTFAQYASTASMCTIISEIHYL